MEKKTTVGVLLLVILIICNLVIGSVLIFFIQDIREPKIDVEFTVSQLTTDELRFSTRISMENNNRFDLLIKDLTLTGKTPQGDTILDVRFDGGKVGAYQHRIFTANETVSFTGDFSAKIFGSVQGVFGVNLAGVFQKEIPFHLNITASFHDLLKNISSPTLSLLAEVTEITENGVLFQGNVIMQNPNFFEMSLENIRIWVETDYGKLVGNFSMLQGSINPDDTSEFPFTGTLSYDALNAKRLSLHVVGSAGVHLMGFDTTIPLSAIAHLLVPDIKELLFQNESLGITISLDAKLRLRGFLTTIGLTLFNPSKIPLQANDLLCSIYGLTGNHQKMIAQKFMEPATIEPTQDYLETQLLIPYLKIFTSGTKTILPDWFVIQIEGNFTIAGVNQSIPVSLNATINPHLLRS